jgi:hypothetical protein
VKYIKKFLSWYWRIITSPETEEEAAYRQWSSF